MDHYQKSLRGAAKNRELALEKYYTDPALCLECGGIIEVGPNDKPSKIKKQRKFCSHSCAASYNGRQRLRSKSEGECEGCGKIIPYTPRPDRRGVRQGYRKVRFCPECRQQEIEKGNTKARQAKGYLTYDVVSEMTRGEIISHYDGNLYRAKVKITDHAQITWRRAEGSDNCMVCGFEHINISHIKDVKDFDLSEKIKVVNSITNPRSLSKPSLDV